MDEADLGNEQMEKWLEAQISEHQYALSHAVSAYPVGECRNCCARIDDGRAFCDSDCAKDFETRQKAEKRNAKYRGG
jgi:hypothetical protein